MTEREKQWHQNRCGKVTSSSLAKLLTKGTKGRLWGDTAVNYLYEKLYELENNKPIRNESNANFRWGHEQEPLAIEWLRANTMYDIKHCSEDFDEIRFTSGGVDDFGDSLDFLADDVILGEIKCLVSQAKFAKYKRCTKADVVDEYADQFCGHFLGNPKSDRLLYLVYDGQSDEDELDTVDPLDPRRGILFEYSRNEFEGLMESAVDRIAIGMAAVRRSLETNGKIETILNS
jgi:hypothetical protein